MFIFKLDIMTQLTSAKRGEITQELKDVADKEGISRKKLMRRVAKGEIVIPKNITRKIEPVGIGKGLKVKLNANIGTSPDYIDINNEIEKAKVALKYGADTIMDLSIGGNIKEIRKYLLEMNAPLGTVPVYEAAAYAESKAMPVVDMSIDVFFRVIEDQARQGVDFMTLHAGVTSEGIERLRRQSRLTSIVSRGGAIMAAWMNHNNRENPLYEEYDSILEIAKEYDVTLSLGDALRPGSIHDATDRSQVQELIILGELVDRAREAGVQVMVEGPGHMPMNQIEANVILQKRLCSDAPFYVLGPLVTDIAPGYDHISGAIGGAIAALAGADFLCYVTPAEHLALPDLEDVRIGVIASKIAAHAADIARGIDVERDNEMARARFDLDWKKQFALCLDRERAEEYRSRRGPKKEEETCSMCGSFCAMKLSGSFL
ncbi:phosphomethylpyrimidine synthase [archaeon]|nr:phosphomethylpyrimidine synthase [archaeon]